MLQNVSWMKGVCVCVWGNRMETIPRNRWTCYEDETKGAGDVASMFKTLGLVLSVTRHRNQDMGRELLRATLFANRM